jgi:hypothetical protein
MTNKKISPYMNKNEQIFENKSQLFFLCFGNRTGSAQRSENELQPFLSSLIIWEDQIKEKLSHPKGKTNKTSNPTSGQQKDRSTHLNVHKKKPMTSSRSEKK